jgi:sugar phosphate isomerase/epimerase
VIDQAKTFGYDGIEWRGGHDGHINPSSTAAERATLRSCSRDAGLIVHSITAYTSFTSQSTDKRRANVDELKRYSDLAAEVGARYVRAFAGEIPQGMQPHSQMIGWIADGLEAAAVYAQSVGIQIVLEPHDDFVRSVDVMQILAHLDASTLKVIWDVGNTYAVGEDYREGYALLAPYIEYVHLKDGLRQGNTWRLCLLGEGDVPLRDILRSLVRVHFEGALCVEWEWAWHRELEPPEIALLHSAHVIRSLLAETNSESPPIHR